MVHLENGGRVRELKSNCKASPQAARSLPQNRKLTDSQVVELRQARALGASYTYLAVRYNVHPKVVQRICVGRVRAAAGGPLQQGKAPPPKHERCPTCGARVLMPCFLCGLKAGREVEPPPYIPPGVGRSRKQLDERYFISDDE